MNKNNELFICIATRYALYSQVCIGISVNIILLLLHVLLLEHRLKPTDLTTSHLALIHTVLQLTTGFIATDIFGSQNFWNDLTCKSVIFLHRLMRGLSISSTCLLSVLQNITLGPRSSCLARFKHKSSTDILCFFLFLWVFNTSIGGRFLISTVATPNVTSASLLFVTKSCSLWPMRHYVRLTFFTLATFRDTSLIGLMVLSSGYMVSLLCRHKRQSKHLHSNRLALRASPVARATQTILLLMSFFVFIYFWDCIISTSSGLSWNNDSVHLCVQMLVGNSYAMVSPLVLISTEKRVIKFLKHMWGKDQKCSVIQR